MVEHGQILGTQPFGALLTKLAQESDTIVEIGAMYGKGSTLCLYAGMIGNKHPKLLALESDRDRWEALSKRFHFIPEIIPIYGAIVRPDQFKPFDPVDSAVQHRENYDEDIRNADKAPMVLDIIPAHIDLLLLDGGDWSSDAEFDLLWQRCNIIALDDTNASKSRKNHNNRDKLIHAGWQTIGDDLNDRNGWFIASATGGSC